MPRGEPGTPMVECPFCKGSGKMEASAITVGLRFKAARGDMTQEEAARRMGISRAQIANIEGDRGKPSFEVLIAAAELYAVSTDFLAGRVDYLTSMRGTP